MHKYQLGYMIITIVSKTTIFIITLSESGSTVIQYFGVVSMGQTTFYMDTKVQNIVHEQRHLNN